VRSRLEESRRVFELALAMACEEMASDAGAAFTEYVNRAQERVDSETPRHKDGSRCLARMNGGKCWED